MLRLANVVGMGARVFVGGTLLVTGCLPAVDNTRIYNEHSVGAARTAEEHREADPGVTATVSGNEVRVTAVQRTECRTTTTTPVEQEEGTGHSLHNGTLAQGLNLAMGGALIASGVAIYAAAASQSCTTTPSATPGDPNPSSVPCTPDQQQTQTAQTRGLGIVTASAAILPLGAFVWNIFRAQDETKTEQVPKTVAMEWRTCSTQPLANARVTVEAGGITVAGQTDGDGVATVDISAITSAATDPQKATVHVAGNRLASSALSLAASPAYGAWKGRQDRCEQYCQDEQIACMRMRGGTGPGAQECLWSDHRAACMRDCSARVAPASTTSNGTDRVVRQTAMVQEVEKSLVSIDTEMTRLERTSDPWGDEQASEIQQLNGDWRRLQNVLASLQEDTPLDPRLATRVLALDPKLTRLAARVPRLKPHVDKLAARQHAQDDFLVGLVAAAMRNQSHGGSFGSGGGNSNTTADDTRIRDLERRQSDMEDQRRRDQTDAAQRKADEDSRRNVARNECSEKCSSRAVLGACNDGCGTNDLSCRNRCSDAAQRCQQDCQSR
jgi:hypothetical protein